MSRICALMPQLMLVEPSSEHSEPRLIWENTRAIVSPTPLRSSSVQASDRTLRCSVSSLNGGYVGSRSLSSPFGSSMVH